MPFPAHGVLAPLCILCRPELDFKKEEMNTLQLLSKSIEDKKRRKGGGRERSEVIYFPEKDSISFCLRHMTCWRGKVYTRLVWGH